ncbi:Calsenilin [Pteropus alecto]|uniref:Calsenilin n=1 Tax=Pteropus alecto TaxID=9402 RepID=L5KTS6_PTEAL|nr:Calsenilin [Pteropus alecto]
MQMSDGSLLGDPRLTPLSKKPGVKWQRPRLTRQALMHCCLVKWILSSAAPQGSGFRDTGIWRPQAATSRPGRVLASQLLAP